MVAVATGMLWLLTLCPSAIAGPPTHLHNPALDISGLNHACGAAVDSKGDVYVASAGESKVKVFDPVHTELTFVENKNEPCGLAVNGKGELFVSEQATGEVVRYKPNAYPFAGAPTYGTREVIDPSGDAKGISVDRFDDRLFIAEGNHVAVYKSDGGFEANVGEPTLGEASGVAAYTSASGDRYLFVADPAGVAADKVYVFSGSSIATLKLRKTIAGVDQDRNPETPNQGLGFGLAGAYLAVDPGNGSECSTTGKSIAEQACTAGHFLVYDDAHSAVDEFDATGEFLDQFTNEALADAQPTAMAIDRSGGPNDGAIYVTVGASLGAKLLGFGPLAAPNRCKGEGVVSVDCPAVSQTVPAAGAVATDFHGNVYVAAGGLIHVYDPSGEEIEVGPEGKGIALPTGPEDIAVDSACNVYVLEQIAEGGRVNYYSPSACPPSDGGTYTRREPSVATSAEFPSSNNTLRAIALNPGPGSGKDHVFITSGFTTHEHDSAAKGSGFLRCFACSLSLGVRQSMGVQGASGKVYFGGNPRRLSVVEEAVPNTYEIVARITGADCPAGKVPANPHLAVDQANGHVLVFEVSAGAVQEFDASGACVAEFGKFTNVFGSDRIAVDSSCALHDPPLTEATTSPCKQFDPANGNAYVAYDDPAPGSFDLTAFGPLAYGEAPLAETGVASNVGGGNATLNGTVNPRGFELTDCHFEYLLDEDYEENVEAKEPPFKDATTTSCVASLVAIGKGSDPVPVHADITGVDPETTRYRFRLLAANKYGESQGKAWLFGPPKITAKPALPVLYDEATLRAEVDPSGLATKYHFEYGTSEAYGQSTPVVEFEPGDGPVAVEATLTGLEEGTPYHFRLVAENEAKLVAGADRTFETRQRRERKACPNEPFRSGLSTNLSDCRAYELVTPAETRGLTLETPLIINSASADAGFDSWVVPPRGTEAGESFVYFVAGTLTGFEGNGILDAYRAQRGSGEHPLEGWRSEPFSPTYLEAVPSIFNSPSPFGIAADHLHSFWKIQPEEALQGTLPEGAYLRAPGGLAGSVCNPEPQQERFELLGCGSLGTDSGATPHFLSAGGDHVLFSSAEHLEEEAPPAGTRAVYDRAAGEASATVVSVKPDGSSFGAGENASYRGATEDGKAIAFKVGGALYVSREGQSTQVATDPNTFAGISSDGKHVFYTTATANDGMDPGQLFAFDLDTEAATEISADSVFVHVSADGSKVFFATEEASEQNLYAWDAQTVATSFVATLDDRDFESFDGAILMTLDTWTGALNPAVNSGRARSPTRSTPGGEVFVFQSHAQLTPYENEGHGEIYRYEPAAAPGERLLCVSCDPAGAPAAGDALLQGVSQSTTGVNRRILITNVTDDGAEIFFHSPDRLLPEDANGVTDVYEWQAKDEAQGCKRQGGCLALISSGQGEGGSFLYGMSADGHDVFFRTREKLVSADVPGSSSVYDARVGGGIPDPPIQKICEGDACQGQGSTPPALPALASTGSGDGNVPGEGKQPCSKGKRRVKGRCLKTHHKRKRHHRRANHNRVAQR